MTVPEIKSLTRSSKGRLARFSELPAPETIEDVIKVLEDETDEKYPIFRTPRPTDRNGTVAVGEYSRPGRHVASRHTAFVLARLLHKFVSVKNFQTTIRL